jgi:hypothetical protein
MRLGGVLLVLVAFLAVAATALGAEPAITLLSWGQSDVDGHGDASGLIDGPGAVALPAGALATMVSGAPGPFEFFLALTSDGTVYGWGSNDCGQLGGQPADRVVAPVAVAGLPPDVVAVDAGEEFGLAATASGQVWAWGRNDLGQLGETAATTTCVSGPAARPAPAPVALPAGTVVVGGGGAAIGGGTGHALALTGPGPQGPATAVYGWGFNGSGQLGRTPGYGDVTPQPPGPMDLPAGTVPAGVSAGNQFSLVRTNAGGVLSTGYGFGGQLGNGDSPAVGTPVLQTVRLPAGRRATQVVAGSETGLAVMDDGGIESWGVGNFGQRGDGNPDTTNVPGPVALPAGTRALAVALGDTSALAVTSTGALLGWGTPQSLNQPPEQVAPVQTPVSVPLPAVAVPAPPALTTNAGMALTATASAPPPVTGTTARAEAVAGTVRVKAPGAGRFSRLDATTLIPIGSTIDTRRGTIKLTTTRGTGGGLQRGRFYDGVFVLRQRKAARAVTNLRLARDLPCKPARASRRASTKRVNGVWGNAKGRYKVTGHDGATAVKGTQWLTQDRCDGTFVRVRSGTVDVRDFKLRRTVTVRAGETYLARRG